MATVAEQLRAAREAQNLDVYQVAEITKIRTEHIRALESGDYDAFAAPVYIRGFIRTYAKVLKLDVPRLLVDVDAELSQTKKFSESPNYSKKRKSILDWIMLQLSLVNWPLMLPLILVALLVAGGVWGYREWRRYKSTDPLSNLGPGIYQPSRTNLDEYLPVPTNAPRK
jgi:cytoskeletal protein RodZ